jgi:hypothetical protein
MPSPVKVKARIKAERLRGPKRPLATLAQLEAHLHRRSQAFAQLSGPQQERPGRELFVHKLSEMIARSGAGSFIPSKLRQDALALYAALPSRDPIDSVYNQLIVAFWINVMNCHARAAGGGGNAQALDMNLRHAEKGTRAIIDLVEARERRHSPKSITVANVNVEAGAQAIVGNVETQTRSKNENDDHGDC